MKRVLSFSLLFMILSCTAPRQTTTAIQRVPAKFDFTPPSRASSGSTGLTIALVRPRFVGEYPEYFVPPFNDMASSMANDFEELLSAKGFTMRGPFGSRDEMVYNDKLNSSLAFEVAIDLQPQFHRKYHYDPGFGVLKAPGYKMTGEIILGGSLVLTASSPQYGEKLWKKSIALDRSTFTYTGLLKWNAVPSMSDELTQDNEIYNVLSRELEKYYAKALNLAWQQIDAQEMKTVAEQAKKADKRG
ncbi:MAG: hypothetical protein EOP48_01035 [Sphingobacteriales bacterium]|nr:MAG: hypothetical protein EOP48_01035 [Sphingobacteriales bacterium]